MKKVERKKSSGQNLHKEGKKTLATRRKKKNTPETAGPAKPKRNLTGS